MHTTIKCYKKTLLPNSFSVSVRVMIHFSPLLKLKKEFFFSLIPPLQFWVLQKEANFYAKRPLEVESLLRVHLSSGLRWVWIFKVWFFWLMEGYALVCVEILWILVCWIGLRIRLKLTEMGVNFQYEDGWILGSSYLLSWWLLVFSFVSGFSDFIWIWLFWVFSICPWFWMGWLLWK